MPTFIIAMNWTEQGIHNVKDAPKRAAQAREIAKKFGVEIKQTYLTNGEFDLCAPAPCGHGRRANITSSFQSCHKHP